MSDPFGPIGPPILPPSELLNAAAMAKAKESIAAKAAALGTEFTGAADAPPQSLPSGPVGERVVQRFAGCTIYYLNDTGAHEIHGAIRDRYDRHNGVDRLGLPLTDEMPCGDGTGRFNDFEKDASIYWHPDTGAFSVRGTIRGQWRQRGAETGPLGYPVHNQGAVHRNDERLQECLFQNGGLSSVAGQTTDESQARLEPDDLMTVIWRIFDGVVHESPDNIGLHPHKSLDAVSGYGPGVREARNRLITFTINGFHDAGLLPDENWSAHIQLQMSATTHHRGPGLHLGEPGHDLFATLVTHNVDASGLANESVGQGVFNGITNAFAQPRRFAAPPNPAAPTLPGEADFIGAIVAADGGLELYFCDTVPGRSARLATQQAMADMVE